ncbi:hypothetical protein B0T17DRAFT_516831 [Bombardia bombarda]|uniref:Uncharacterized protein n=1 Tax=Bombardia bombarda TaxID=252184 RepID=A0AA39XKE3_9PEZI|nr:hypothetical protein B0T17DRAFT_516831 [Bombardia bombarda]
MSMLHTLENIPRLHNILVSCFAWILLAGFVIVPGSFTSLRRLQADSIVDENGQDIPAGPVGGHNALRYTTTNTWVTVVGFLCMGVGALGALWLGLRWRKNYVWLINKLYLPLMLNALAGGISTLVNVYTQQYSAWRVQARVAFAVEAFVFLLSGILFAIYNFWLLEKVKADHANGRFPGSSSSATAGVKGKSRVKKFSFLARFDSLRRRPPVAPGSVV